ncbi:MAG: ChaN family lipoprotein [Candidatus Aminicenantes bacterium]|nr:MAG: ChaN family lipoprotein [Candidatus Aminicenantes bacterium]
MNARKIITILVLILVSLFLRGEEEEDKILLLKIGNERLKDKTIDISAGKIYSLREGKPISFSKMIKEMSKSHFVYVGETHNSLPMHEIQLKIIQALYEQERKLSVGLEMYPGSVQETLNKWSMGILSRDEFTRESQWYVNWSYNFGFYENMFKFSKENKIPLYALNVPREIIREIRFKGWDSLSAEKKKIVPQPDLSHQEHRLLIRTIFESTELPHQMKGKGLEMVFEGLYRAQSAWDEVMAFNAFQANRREKGKMVVLAGSGHLFYNLGINRRVYERSSLPFKTVICVVVPEEQESVKVSRSLADYIWSIPEEKLPAFPSVGLRFKKFDGLRNFVIETKPIDGAAKYAGFEKGDVVLSVDGKSFSEINELRIYLARFKWNDEVEFGILRDGQQIKILLKFQVPEE